MMNRLMDALLDLRNGRAVLVVLLSNWEGNEEQQRVGPATARRRRGALVEGQLAPRQTGRRVLPARPRAGQITMAQFLFDTPPPADDVAAVWQASEMMVEQLLIVYLRLVGRLAHIAEQVETALGLPLLPDPPEKEGA